MYKFKILHRYWNKIIIKSNKFTFWGSRLNGKQRNMLKYVLQDLTRGSATQLSLIIHKNVQDGQRYMFYQNEFTSSIALKYSRRMTHYFPFRFMYALHSIFMMTIYMYRYIPFAVVTIQFSFSFSWLITRIWIRVARLVPLLEYEIRILPENLSSPSVFSGVRVTRSLVFCVMFCIYRCLSCYPFSFVHCIVCSSMVASVQIFFDNHPNCLICPRDTIIHLK